MAKRKKSPSKTDLNRPLIEEMSDLCVAFKVSTLPSTIRDGDKLLVNATKDQKISLAQMRELENRLTYLKTVKVIRAKKVHELLKALEPIINAAKLAKEYLNPSNKDYPLVTASTMLENSYRPRDFERARNKDEQAFFEKHTKGKSGLDLQEFINEENTDFQPDKRIHVFNKLNDLAKQGRTLTLGQYEQIESISQDLSKSYPPTLTQKAANMAVLGKQGVSTFTNKVVNTVAGKQDSNTNNKKALHTNLLTQTANHKKTKELIERAEYRKNEFKKHNYQFPHLQNTPQ